MQNSAPTLKQEVEALLAEMRAAALTVEDIRDTVEMQAIVRVSALPSVEPNLIPAMARATLMGAWVQYAARRAQPDSLPSASTHGHSAPSQKSESTRAAGCTMEQLNAA